MIAPASPLPGPPVVPPGADAIRAALLAGAAAKEASPVRQALARGLAAVVAPVLAWARDHAGVALTPGQVRRSLQLDAIAALVERRVLLVADAGPGAGREIPVPNLPAEMLARLRAYLGQVPPYDPGLSYAEQNTRAACELHAYAISPLDPALGAAVAGVRP